MATTNLTPTAAVIGTGPSLTMRQVEVARAKGFTLIGCNRVFLDVPDLDHLYGCNWEFWKTYASTMVACQLSAECWTSAAEAQTHAPWVRYLEPVDAGGLSPRPERPLNDHAVIHHGHSTGFQALQLAWLLGFERIVLLGYDMQYAPDYDGKRGHIGSTPRHYFGEYPRELQHWPSKSVENGKHVELVRLYGTVAEDASKLGVQIINATPTSALDCFPRVAIEDVGGATAFLRDRGDA